MTRFKILRQLLLKLRIRGKCSKSHMAALKASMDKLPIEIVTLIFIQAVDDPQLRPLLLKLLTTSRWVYNILQPLLYHTIQLKTDHQAQRFLYTIKNKSSLCALVVNFDVPLVGVPPQAWPGRQQAEFCLPYYAALDKKGPQLKTVSSILSILLKETATIVKKDPQDKGKGKAKETADDDDAHQEEDGHSYVYRASPQKPGNEEGQGIGEEGSSSSTGGTGATDSDQPETMILNGPLGPLRLQRDTTRTLIVKPIAQKLRSTNINALPFTLPPRHHHPHPSITISPALRLPVDVTLSGIGILSFTQWDFRYVERLRFTSIMVSEILRIGELAALPRLKYLSVPLYKNTPEGAKELLKSETLKRLVIFTIFTGVTGGGVDLAGNVIGNAYGNGNQSHSNANANHAPDTPVITISTGSTTTIISPPTPIVGTLTDTSNLALTPVSPVPVTPVAAVAPVPFAAPASPLSGSAGPSSSHHTHSSISPIATSPLISRPSHSRNLLNPLAPLTRIDTASVVNNATLAVPNTPTNPTVPNSPISPSSPTMPLSPGAFSTFSTTSNVNLGPLGEIDDDRLVLYHLRDMVKLHHLTSDQFWDQVEHRAVCCTSRFLSEV